MLRSGCFLNEIVFFEMCFFHTCLVSLISSLFLAFSVLDLVFISAPWCLFCELTRTRFPQRVSVCLLCEFLLRYDSPREHFNRLPPVYVTNPVEVSL